MQKNRLEAFSDGVLAIIITIMVLEMKVPHEPTLAALTPIWPVFVSYVLSFVFIGIYWNNHHHMMHLVHKVNGRILWANIHLLFWLSLVPFVSGWMGENHFAKTPTGAYGVVLLMCGFAYWLLQRAIMADQREEGHLARAIGRDLKGKFSLVTYVVAIGCSFWNEWVSIALYAVVAAVWFIPDRRIEAQFPS
ncbi:MAG TPA: TMEM175 family protein [Fimbriimonadaceae bacterium]|nr:hypothetical protein [Armatimonadota bacterium]HCM73639.1 hypothetical protein [Armatimonadota bacterium]HRD32161.1 TMEM175 family protein [Fimbriimonadaceae bacterium]HRE93970.1 TMEM175 family protein [Fimbriimonadaceae bacterium]HRI74844.1 TMEM175 family protein [Fimbriimonadaceae bacterium]